MSDGFRRVAGLCPMGCGETLFLDSGGHVTCSLLGCPDPCRADAILTDPLAVEHVVEIERETFTVLHPLRERSGELFECHLHGWLAAQDGPPVKPGRYVVEPDPTGDWCFRETERGDE